MLRIDRNARFRKERPRFFSAIFSRKVYRFRCKQGGREIQQEKFLTEKEYQSLLAKQQEDPVNLLTDGVSGRTWWMFRDRFYWEDDGLRKIEVKALLLERIRKDERRIKRAIRLMEQENLPHTAREPVPGAVREFVWRRDQGRCVKCNSEEDLEFDHIIPVSKGGSNTEKNIQLLCVTCNRSKGANLG